MKDFFNFLKENILNILLYIVIWVVATSLLLRIMATVSRFVLRLGVICVNGFSVLFGAYMIYRLLGGSNGK